MATHQDDFKHSAKEIEIATGFSAQETEIILRTAEMSLQMGAASVSVTTQSFGDSRFPSHVWDARLVVENKTGDQLGFSVTRRGYALTAKAFGMSEHEEVLLYLRALSTIRTHCEPPVTTVQ